MSRDRVPVGIAVAMLIGAVVAAVVLTPAGGALVGSEARAAFLDAWRASRLATYAADTTFERTGSSGATLRAEGWIAQRPPDRLVVQFGGVDGQLDGHVLLCSTDPSGRYRCTEGAAVPDYARQVDREVATLAGYFEPSRPLYEVTGDGRGCFRLRLAIALPAPPFGTSAQFCFDEATGAQVFAQVVRPEAVEITRATVRGEVTDDDLEIPDQPPPATTE